MSLTVLTQIFLFSIIGVLLTDYYILSKGRLDLAWLYTADRSGPYHYIAGFNLRAFTAYLVGVADNFSGCEYSDHTRLASIDGRQSSAIWV